MVQEATRGVRFVLRASTDESVGAEFGKIATRAAQLQNMLGNFKLGGLDLGRFQTSVDKAHAELDALHRHAMQPMTIPAPIVHTATYQPGLVGGGGRGPARGSAHGVATQPVQQSAQPHVDAAAYRAALDRMVEQHRQAEEKMTADSASGAARRAAIHGQAARIAIDLERLVTAATAGEIAKRASVAQKGAAIQIAMLLEVQKHEGDLAKAQTAAAAAEIARLRAVADAQGSEEAAATAAIERMLAARLGACAEGEAREEERVRVVIAVADEEVSVSSKTNAAKAAADRKHATLHRSIMVAMVEGDRAAAQHLAETIANIHAQGLKSQQRDAEQAAGEREQLRKKEEADERRAAQAREQAIRKVTELTTRFQQSLKEAASGASEFAQGLVEVGVVGEEDFGKVRDAVEGVTTVFDTVRAGLQTWHSLTEAAKLYREGLEAVEKVEKAVAAAEAARKVMDTASGAAGAAGTAGKVASAGGSIGSVVSGLGGLVAAINPVTVAFVAVGAIVLGTVYALRKYTESVEAAERKDKEARQKELEIREMQNAALMKIFAAEQHAREQTQAKEQLELKVSQEFGAKRAEYEKEADQRGLKSGARDQFIANQANMDQVQLQMEQTDKELAAAKAEPDRSRHADEELPTAEARRPISNEDQQRLDQIERRLSDRRFMVQSEESEGTGNSLTAKWAREEIVQLGVEKGEIMRKYKPPAEGQNKFDADENVKVASADKVEKIMQRKAQLELQMAELKREGFRQEMQALDEELQKQQQLIEGDEERVKSARQYADQQHKAYQDALVAFGMLTKGQRQRLVEIHEKLERGETLNRKDAELGMQHLDEKDKDLIGRQIAGSLSERERNVFGEKAKRGQEAEEQHGKEAADAKKNEEGKQKILQRIDEANERHRMLGGGKGGDGKSGGTGGSEKGEVTFDAKGHATVEIKWDAPQSKLIADALKPTIKELGTAIEEMLKEASAQIKNEVYQTMQRKSQQGAAGAPQ